MADAKITMKHLAEKLDHNIQDQKGNEFKVEWSK